jgi:hypothetical protein
VKVDPKFGGQWNVPMFGGQWNVPLLGGQWNVKEKHLSTSSHFPPNKLTSTFDFFSFDLEVLLYHGDRSLFTPFLFFSSIYKLRLCILI